ncbi:hypothetical protein WJX84_000597, partial [Apatococcus fuscideae]
ALRRLVAKLLARAELVNFRHQDEAVRPFMAILRHADSPSVREATVQCIAQAINLHPRSLGSGWRSVLEALAIAACDKTDTIVDQALDAVQPVIEGLFRPNAAIPADLFPLCLAVLSQAMRNSHHEKLSISAVYLAQTAGHCLAASNPTEWHMRPSSSHSRRASAGDTGSSRRPSQDGESFQAQHPWGLLLGTLALVARHDPRTEVADQAAAGLLECMRSHSAKWDGGTWHAAHSHAIAYLFEAPFAKRTPTSGAAPRMIGWSVEGMQRIRRYAMEHLPQLFQLIADSNHTALAVMLQNVLGLLAEYILQPDEGLAVVGIQCLEQLVELIASCLDGPGWQAVLRTLSLTSSAEHLHWLIPASPSKSGHAEHPNALDSNTAALGQLHSFATSGVTPAEGLHCRCRVTLLMQRVLSHLHVACTPHMPLQTQLQLLAVLQDTVQRAAALNRNSGRRAAIGQMLAAGDSPAPQASSSPTSGRPVSPDSRQPSSSSIPKSDPDSRPMGATGSSAFNSSTDAPEPIPEEGTMSNTSSMTDLDSADASASLTEQPIAEEPAAEGTSSSPGTTGQEADSAAEAVAGSGSGLQDDWELVNGKAGASEQQPPNPTEGAPIPNSTPTGAGPRVSSVPAWSPGAEEETMQPALIRQEAEGGVLLISALLRCMQAGDALDTEAAASPRQATSDAKSGMGAASSHPGWLREEAERRLLSLCRRLVVDAASDAWSRHSAATQAAESGLSITPDGTSWDQAIRAPLIVAMLDGYRDVRTEALRKEITSIFPHLARLACSAQPSVRRTLSSLFEAQLPPLVEGL